VRSGWRRVSRTGQPEPLFSVVLFPINRPRRAR